jgi:hypothetical protein
MPTTAFQTFNAAEVVPLYDDGVKELPFRLANSASIARGTIVGEVTATPGYIAAYASGNSDGSQTPIGIMHYDVASDSSGNITIGSATAGASSWGQTYTSCPVYVQGDFSCADLTGLDATAITNWKVAHLLFGSTSAGALHIG